MSVTEYQYTSCTHDDLEACVRWCQNQFQLRDWEIDLSTSAPQDDVEADIANEYGKAAIDDEKFKASVWINLALCEADNCNMLVVCVHEMLHVMQEARGASTGEPETITLEPLLYRLYCRENKIKIAGEK